MEIEKYFYTALLQYIVVYRYLFSHSFVQLRTASILFGLRSGLWLEHLDFFPCVNTSKCFKSANCPNVCFYRGALTCWQWSAFEQQHLAATDLVISCWSTKGIFSLSQGLAVFSKKQRLTWWRGKTSDLKEVILLFFFFTMITLLKLDLRLLPAHHLFSKIAHHI